MSERVLHASVKKRLINNEPFAYAHLVKFERPFPSEVHGLASTDAKRYGYFSDASFNISFDDGTTDVMGNSNGAQTYYADKVFKVAGFSETTDPKATSISLELAAESLFNTVTASMQITGTTITASGINFMEEGFREGDKILVSSGGGSNTNKEFKVTGIKTSGTVLTISAIDDAVSNMGSAATTTLKIVSDELKGPLVEINNQASLKSYYNRQVSIFKVFLDPDDNSIIGTPYLIFRGLINKADIKDSPGKSLRVSWHITSHWGDFVQVNGRLSNDAVHRALDNEGAPQPLVTKKEAYAWDLGFAHAEDTINVLATYKHSQEEMRFKTKKKWFKSKTKIWYETVVTDRDVNLNFSLSAKYIPIVYGIDKIAGKPIFVDTKLNDSNNVFVAEMLCEGEIGGIYDIYIDGKPSICFNKEDYDERNSTNGTAKADAAVVCRGRADIGQTIGGAIISGKNASGNLVSGSTEYNWDVADQAYSYGGDGFKSERQNSVPLRANRGHTRNKSLSAVTTTADGQGVTDRMTYEFEVPNEIYGTFHAGKEDQLADDTLLEIQNNPGFKRGTDYYTGDEIYFGPNHRMLDTAYVVNEIVISQDATTIPEFEYVVRGKLIDCYNYDYSYQHTPNNLDSSSGESANNFAVGDSVTLYKTSDDSVLNADVFIIDKWAMRGADGVEEYRFRFSDAPDLNYTDGIPAIKQFYMKKGSNTWHMWTHDIEAITGTVATKAEITSTAVTTPSNGPPTWTFASTTISDIILGGTTTVQTFDDVFMLGKTDGWIAEQSDSLVTIYDQLPVTITGTGPYTATGTTGSVGTGLSTDATQTVIDANGIIFPSSASSSDDSYNGLMIQLYEEDAAGNVTLQERIIEDYDGSDRYATIGSSWDAGNEPMAKSGSTYTYKIILPTGDRRVSINPAMQLMDFITSKTYGKSLNPDEDLSKSDWLSAARTCDTRGTQTLSISSGSATAGDRFALTSDGTTSGTIVSIGRVQATISSATSVIMEECFGNFVKEFRKNSTYYNVGDIVWTSEGYFRCTSAGYKAAKPTAASHTGWSAVMTSFPIHKLEQTGSANTKATNITATTLSVVGSYTDNAGTTRYQNPVDYSLYDSSIVKYWRYLGWEDHHQRWVTRHQTCGTIDTAAPVLDTVGGFLEHMNGMLTFEAGKYVLKIATTTDAIASAKVTASNSGGGQTYAGYTPGSEANIRWIREEDIIGAISLKDKGVQKAYNTVNSNIEMPQTQWKGKSVSFYDSNYLKSDKMIVKQGSMAQPSVINYFNARINVENFLRQSRFGLSISFKMGPKALLLKAGLTVAISHDKFGWSGKIFRITNINYAADCTATITAEEYDDSFYTIDPPSLPSILNEDFRAPLEAPPGTPSSLAASAGQVGSINLTWTKASGITANSETEIWVNSSNSQYGTILATLKGDVQSFQHNIGLDNATRYYWIRHKKTTYKRGQQKIFYGAYHGSANATTVIPSSLYQAILQSDAGTFQVNNSDVITAPSDITFTLTRHNLAGTGGDTGAIAFTTSPSVTLTGSGDTRVLSSANFGSNTAVTVTATVTSTTDERAGGANNTYTSSITVTRSVAGTVGSNGTNAKTVNLTVDDYSIVYDVDGANPSPSGTMTLTATSQNFTNGYFKFTGDGISDEGSYTDGSGANADTFSFSVPASYFSTPKSIRVGVAEGDQTEVAFDTISIAAVKPGATGAAGVDGLTFILTNSSHTFPAAANGAVSSYTGSGTIIEVYEGSTALAYDGTGTSNSTWKTVESATNISVGTKTDSGAYLTVGDHSAVGNGTDTSKIIYTVSGKRANGTAFSHTLQQSFTKSKIGSAGADGPKTATGQIFYNTEQANAPTAPSNTSVAFNFSTGAMTGGVMGTGSSEWSVTPPTASAGATTSKIWYVYYSVTESSAGSGTGQPTFDSTVKQGTGFTNLVTFSSGNFQQNGSNITTIDGGNITTGTIAAARIGAGTFTVSGGGVGGWTIDSSSIYSGTKDTSGYTSTNGHITLSSSGSIHTPKFFVDADGTAGFKGTLTIGTTDLDETNTLNTNTTWANVAGTPNAPANNATNTNAPESANHSSGSVGGWTISASKIYSTYVEIDNTNHRILIKDS